MSRLENRRDHRTFAQGLLPGPWPFVILLAAWVVVACAPAAGPQGAIGAALVELEVGVATDCDAGVDVVVVVDGETYSFAGLGLTEAGDPELPLSGTVRVPGRRGAPYDVMVTHGCDGARRTEITTFLVQGEERRILASSTARGRGPVQSSGGM